MKTQTIEQQLETLIRRCAEEKGFKPDKCFLQQGHECKYRSQNMVLSHKYEKGKLIAEHYYVCTKEIEN